MTAFSVGGQLAGDRTQAHSYTWHNFINTNQKAQSKIITYLSWWIFKMHFIAYITKLLTSNPQSGGPLQGLRKGLKGTQDDFKSFEIKENIEFKLKHSHFKVFF